MITIFENEVKRKKYVARKFIENEKMHSTYRKKKNITITSISIIASIWLLNSIIHVNIWYFLICLVLHTIPCSLLFLSKQLKDLHQFEQEMLDGAMSLKDFKKFYKSKEFNNYVQEAKEELFKSQNEWIVYNDGIIEYIIPGREYDVNFRNTNYNFHHNRNR